MDNLLCLDDQNPSESSVNIVFLLEQITAFTNLGTIFVIACQMTSFPLAVMARIIIIRTDNIYTEPRLGNEHYARIINAKSCPSSTTHARALTASPLTSPVL